MTTRRNLRHRQTARRTVALENLQRRLKSGRTSTDASGRALTDKDVERITTEIATLESRGASR